MKAPRQDFCGHLWRRALSEDFNANVKIRQEKTISRRNNRFLAFSKIEHGPAWRIPKLPLPFILRLLSTALAPSLGMPGLRLMNLWLGWRVPMPRVVKLLQIFIEAPGRFEIFFRVLVLVAVWMPLHGLPAKSFFRFRKARRVARLQSRQCFKFIHAAPYARSLYVPQKASMPNWQPSALFDSLKSLR